MNKLFMKAIVAAAVAFPLTNARAYADNELGGSPGELKVSVEDFVTCVPHVSLTGLDVPDVTSVEFQSARTAEGPWTTFAKVASPEGGVAAANHEDAIVGVPLYYRVVVNAATSTASSAVPFTRFRRLERDPANETGGFVNGYVQIMEKYRTDNYRNKMKLAFDGKADTWPDSTMTIDGTTDLDRAKVGIDFGEAGVFFAGGRVYPRYSNNKTTRSEGAYFSAANEESFSDEVAISDLASFNNQAFWLFLPSKDAVHPYRYVWIWKPTGNWYANVAEVQFYGWTQKDIDDSGLVIPPDAVTLARGAATGSAVVGWSGGANVTSFAVERRVAGESDWTTVASELPATDTSWADADLTVGETYEYRVVAHGKGSDSIATPLVSLYVYETGDGTGLRAVLHGPIASPSYGTKSAGQCDYREFRNDAAIDLNTALAGQTLYAQTNLASALVHWRGKLIVPEDGDYTLGLEVKGCDGYSIWVDDAEVANHNCLAGKAQVSLPLTVGEHPIRIEWASRAKDNVRFCRLTWACAGKFAEEVIPSLQLKPETDDSAFPNYAIDGYTFALPLCYWSDCYLPRFERKSEGNYTIYWRSSDVNMNAPDFGSTVDGPFRAEVTVDKSDAAAARPQLAVRSVADGRNMIAFLIRSDLGQVNVKATYQNQAAGIGDVTTWIACANPVRLRVDRDRDMTLHFYYKGAGQTAWTEIFTYYEGRYYYDKGEQKTRAPLTGKSLRVSFAAAGDNATGVVDCHSHDFTVKPRLTGMMLLVR